MNGISARTRAWRVSDDDFYELESRGEQLAFLLQYAILAPSGHNTQPWFFKITDEGIEVYADGSRALPVVDPEERELLMSVGTAITNLRVAAAHFGFDTIVLYQPRPETSLPVALVTCSETSDPDRRLASLFGAIKRRHTNRHDFDEAALDSRALTALCDLAGLYPETLSPLLPIYRSRPPISWRLPFEDRWRAKVSAMRSRTGSVPALLIASMASAPMPWGCPKSHREPRRGFFGISTSARGRRIASASLLRRRLC